MSDERRFLPMVIELPALPPAALAKNRAPGHPLARARVWKSQVADVALLISNRIQHVGDPPRIEEPMVIDVEWRQRGGDQQRADPDAVVARAVSPAMDAAQRAGLVANDRLLAPGVITFTRVRTRESEGVTLTFRYGGGTGEKREHSPKNTPRLDDDTMIS